MEQETQLIKDKIIEKLGNNQPIEQDVVILYEGENTPEKVTNFSNDPDSNVYMGRLLENLLFHRK